MIWGSEASAPLVGVKLSGASSTAGGPSVSLEVLTDASAAEGSRSRESLATVAAGYRMGFDLHLGGPPCCTTMRGPSWRGRRQRALAGPALGVVARAGAIIGEEVHVSAPLRVGVELGLPLYVGRAAEEFAVRWGATGWVHLGVDL